MRMETERRFSIITPVYNAELYLDQCIQSVICQSLNFTQNVELILVNDGSTDGSGKICEKYKQNYPHNVQYIYQENAGVSAARNRGLAAASGNIIGFLDSDDKFSRNTLKMVESYFQIALDTADVAIIPVTNFGARTIPYYLNGKFKNGMRTVDLENAAWNDICMRVGQAFIRAEAAKRHSFDQTVTYFEDCKYINEIISEKMRIGLVTGCQYYYRRYPAEADATVSLTIGAERDQRLYLETPAKVPLFFLERYQNPEGIPLYFQYLALAEMRWRTFYTQQPPRCFLPPEKFAEYESLNERILDRISDRAIMTFGHYAPWQKLYLLQMKYDKDVLPECRRDDDGNLIWKDQILCAPAGACVLLLDVQIENTELVVKWYADTITTEKEVCFARSGGKNIPAIMSDEGIPASRQTLDYDLYQYPVYCSRIPLAAEKSTVCFGMNAAGNDVFFCRVSPSRFGKCTQGEGESQFCNGFQIVFFKNRLEIYRDTLGRRIGWCWEKILKKPKTFARKVLQAAKKGPRFFLSRVKARLSRMLGRGK